MCERWIDWLRAADPAEQIQFIARVAMAHYQFETLHPFIDGNGRVGRLVAILQLMHEGALRSPVLSVSPLLKECADEYRDRLLAVIVGPPKTDAGRRTVSIPTELLDDLRCHVEAYAQPGEDGYVFTGAKGRTARTPRAPEGVG